MRILHVDTGSELRGGQYQTLLLWNGLARANCDQTLLAGAGIRARHGEFEPANWRSIRRNARSCDLIHAHDARAHSLALLHGTGRPVVVARRVSFPIGSGLGSRWKYRRAAHFIAISKHVAGLLQRAGVPGRKISVVPDAVPDAFLRPDEAGPAEPCPNRTSGRFQVVAPLIRDPLKCKDLALAACTRADVPLHFSADLAADLPDADALLYLSRSEGLGSAILLAMAFGVPTVASDVGGIPEIVQHESTGLLVENDAESIAAALRRLRGNGGLRARLAATATAQVRADFTQERLTDRTVQAYRRALGEASRCRRNSS